MSGLNSRRKKLQLRRACQKDRDLLFAWVNDNDVRENAFHTEKIPYENHVKWFEKMMADPLAYQYILYEDMEPVGQIRINIEGSEALIDYSISFEKRGKGYGSELLRLIQTQIIADKIPNVIKLVGQVKYKNPASAKAFEKCGFFRKELPEYIQYEKEIRRCY